MEELSANGLWPREGMPFQPQEDTENGGCFPPQAISRSADQATAPGELALPAPRGRRERGRLPPLSGDSAKR